MPVGKRSDSASRLADAQRHLAILRRASRTRSITQRFCILSASLLLFLGRCHYTDTSYREYRYFYTMLNPALVHQTAIVDRSYTVEEPTPDSTTFGIQGARIVLSLEGSSDSTVFVESTAIGLYRTSDSGWVQPCSSYRIRITSDSFFGETRLRVPGRFQILFPPDGTHFTDQDSLQPLVWTRSPCAAAYRIAVQDSSPRRRRLFNLPLVLPDSITAIDLHPFSLFDSSSTYYVKIYAMDSSSALRRGTVDTIGQDFLALTGAHVLNQVKVYFQRTGP
jgi:hypothetical protein